ncbi:ADP-ribosylglycohydrolase family protein [Lacticaseibacillus kribbianus]|uniref:ADP-ribosylglycohydrolase family protein n=1 Tax=Lacticaseibacillus kribbianus TaxID=2926292 RepID=UPI001CD1C0B2|nr:ADP-ribosylglycohydrolase family protein [Lacticaseibacillus kribbianus]
MTLITSRLTHGTIGAALGSALGLPLVGTTVGAHTPPITGMTAVAGGPTGAYSNDTALAQAGLAALASGFAPAGLMTEYRQWAQTGAYAAYPTAPRHTWPATAAALGGRTPARPDADPGALLRSLPVGFFLHHQFGENWLDIPAATDELATFVNLTNPGLANRIATTMYLQAVTWLLAGQTLPEALDAALNGTLTHYQGEPVALDFALLAGLDAAQAKTLAAGPATPRNVLGVAWYSLQATDDFAPAVLTAANFGHESAAYAALAGGLAGLAYGYLRIPHRWCLLLTRYGEIVQRVQRAEKSGFFEDSDEA